MLLSVSSKIASFTDEGTWGKECDIFQEIFKDIFKKMFEDVKKPSDESEDFISAPHHANRCFYPSKPGSSRGFDFNTNWKITTTLATKSVQDVITVKGDCWVLRGGRLWVFHCRFSRNRRMKGHSVFVVAIGHDDKQYVWNTRHNCSNSRRCRPAKVILPNFCVLCGRPFMVPMSYRGKRPHCTGCRVLPLLVVYIPDDLCRIVQAYV